jgi:hypothetical protein
MAQMVCDLHPEHEMILLCGYKMCVGCSRGMERNTMLSWIAELHLGLSVYKLSKYLAEMMGSYDYGFSTFPKLYNRFPRGHRSKKGNFSVSQKDYLQSAFVSYINDKRRG